MLCSDFDLSELADAVEALLGVHVDIVSERGLDDAHAAIRQKAIELLAFATESEDRQ